MKFIRYFGAVMISIGVLVTLLFGLKMTTGTSVFGGGFGHAENRSPVAKFSPLFKGRPFKVPRKRRDKNHVVNQIDLSNTQGFLKVLGPEALAVFLVVLYDKRVRKKRAVPFSN